MLFRSLARGLAFEYAPRPGEEAKVVGADGVPFLPPEPFKRLGGGIVRAAIIAAEEAEEEGRRPSLAARTGAALPRLLRMQIGTR